MNRKLKIKPFNGSYPQIPDSLSIAYMVVTMLIMAYSTLFKVFPILIFLALWFAHTYYKKTFILRPSADFIFVLLVPLFCTYSTFWSDTPGATFYLGAGLVMMTAATVIIARTVSTEGFVKGISLGAMAVLIITLVSGRYASDYFTHETSLIGLFSSKNEVGFFAETGALAAIILLFTKTRVITKFIFSILPLVVCLICLHMSRSASSVIALTIALGGTFGIYLLSRVPPAWRAIVVGFGILCLITLGMIMASTNADIFDPILKVFGKDTTLTGRTYLWSEGIRNGLKRPILGYGYFAFWIAGRPEPEHYWAKFQIPGKTGFHFHNLFVQTFVDLGFVGLSLVLLLLFMCLYKSIRAILKDGIGLESSMAMGLSFMFLIRGFVEVDLFGPFGIGPLLYLSIVPRLACLNRKKDTAHANN